MLLATYAKTPTEPPLSNCVGWNEFILVATHEDKFSLDYSQIMIFHHATYPCNVDPLTPHFYQVKLGFTGVNIISSPEPKAYR